MAFDAKCYELAEAFLEDVPKRNTPENRQKLAQTIQDAIEDWLTEGDGCQCDIPNAGLPLTGDETCCTCGKPV